MLWSVRRARKIVADVALIRLTCGYETIFLCYRLVKLFFGAFSTCALSIDLDVNRSVLFNDAVNMSASFGIFEDVDTGQQFVVHETRGLLGRYVPA